MADTNEAQLLSDLLSDIAREDACLDAPHLEARVLSACARPMPPSSGATRLRYWTIAAVIALAAFVPQLVTRDVPKHTTEMQVEPIEQSIAETPRMVAESPVPTRRTRLARPGPPTRPTIPTQPTIPDFSPDEFLPLMPMTEQELTGPFQLVRVQMPRASLGTLRSPLEHPNELVEADVLLGEDGMARAIRVSTSGSVYPWRSR